MAADTKAAIDRLRDRIRASGEISDSDRERLIQFSDQLRLLKSDYSDERHLKLLRHSTIMAEEAGGLDDALRDRSTAERIARWINETYENEETNRDYRVTLRVFGRRLVEADSDLRESVDVTDKGYPTSVAWISSGTSSNYDPSPEPANMLRWHDDILPMIEEARNDRDAAALALAFDAGPRGGEMDGIRVGDVSDNRHGLQVTVSGKVGKRTITLIPSVPYVRRWLEAHPASDDPDAPLWSKLESPEPLSYRMMMNMLERPGKRAGVDKELTPTNFRKSSAAHLASKGMNQAHIEDHHGWTRGSKAASRYVSIFSDDADRELARVYGKEVPKDESDEIAPLDCPRCGRETPREKELCVWCGQALEPGAAEKADRIDDTLVAAIAKAEGERAEELLDIRDRVRDDSELLADVVDQLAPLMDE